jgi:hypothetical protein
MILEALVRAWNASGPLLPLPAEPPGFQPSHEETPS